MYPGAQHLRDEYFPISASFPRRNPSGARESLALAIDANKAESRKPVLLLVDDNEINLKVCLDHQELGNFSRPSSPVSGLMLAKLLETFTKKNSYEYDTAENGLLALQAFQNARHLYDIVLMGKKIVSKRCSVLTRKQTSRCQS
jgi:hypothetical protein